MRIIWRRLYRLLATLAGHIQRTGFQLGRRLRSRAVATALAGVIAALSFSGYVTGLNAYIVHDGNTVSLHTTYTSDAREALLEAGITLSNADIVSLPNAPVDGSAEITIKRGISAVIRMDGRIARATCYGGTVSTLLSDMGYSLSPQDLVSPAPETPITDGIAITVTRVTTQREDVVEEIAFDIIQNSNPNLNYGTEVVTQEGVPGEKTYTYETRFEDGVQVSRELVLEAVTVEPVAKVVEQGTIKTVKTSDNQVLQYSRKLECTATAYTTEHTSDKINALGKIARVGTIAVDPKVIPMRSRVYVTSANGTWIYGLAVCEDTGGSIKGNKVDLFFDTVAECFQFGRRKCIVYVLD